MAWGACSGQQETVSVTRSLYFRPDGELYNLRSDTVLPGPLFPSPSATAVLSLQKASRLAGLKTEVFSPTLYCSFPAVPSGSSGLYVTVHFPLPGYTAPEVHQ